jgi:hypothetical protein
MCLNPQTLKNSRPSNDDDRADAKGVVVSPLRQIALEIFRELPLIIELECLVKGGKMNAETSPHSLEIRGGYSP